MSTKKIKKMPIRYRAGFHHCGLIPHLLSSTIMHMKNSGGRALSIACGLLLLAGCRQPPEHYNQTLLPGETTFFIPNSKKMIALTLDDGPNGTATEQILNALKDRHVPATFFLIGANVDRFPSTARRIVSEGHLVGNHTGRHSRFDQISIEEIARDITEGSKAIETATGVRPFWLRPPYGINGVGLTDICRTQGFAIAGWSLDANDWNPHPVEDLVDAIVSQATAGDIILLHDGWETRQDIDRSATVAAVPIIVDRLKEAGFIFVTLAELLRNAGKPVAEFENGIRLLGIQMNATPVCAGSYMAARYFWDVPETGASNLSRAFVHILKPGDKFWFQDDHRLPLRGDVRDMVMRRAIPIPSKAPEGTYEVDLGLFYPARPEKGNRLKVRSDFPQHKRAIRAPVTVKIIPAAHKSD